MRNVLLALLGLVLLTGCAESTAPVIPAPGVTCTAYVGPGGVVYDVCR